jgi:hypothetical protein
MRKKWSLGWQFWVWIVGGLLLFVVGLLWTKQSLCHANLSYMPTWLCEETKFTDLLLAYFTYCLVIVGWFTMRNSEMNTQNLERAFLQVGPTKITTLFRPANAQGITTPFVRLMFTVHNTGRTGAIITKAYGEFSRSPPTGNKPIYKHGQEKLTDLSIAADESVPLTPIIFETNFVGQQFFWGYLEYLDIFKIKQSHSRQAVRPSKVKFAIIGRGLCGRYDRANTGGVTRQGPSGPSLCPPRRVAPAEAPLGPTSGLPDLSVLSPTPQPFSLSPFSPTLVPLPVGAFTDTLSVLSPTPCRCFHRQGSVFCR